MIDTAALDRSVRRCPLLLHLIRKHGMDEARVRVMMPLIIERYHQEVTNGPVRETPRH